VNDTAASVDRSRNVIITGVEESRKMSVWRDTVARILVITAGRDVRIEDAFRLGRFNNQRSRPILVKLASVWDRRLILSGSHKLNSDVQFIRRVYVNADEPLEVKRKHTLDRLRNRAQSRGQTVSVSYDGVLSVDGNEYFCLKRGFVNRHSMVDTVHDG